MAEIEAKKGVDGVRSERRGQEVTAEEVEAPYTLSLSAFFLPW